MLRARKVLAYVAERVESERLPPEAKDQPDDFLELICQEKVALCFFKADCRLFLRNGRCRRYGHRFGDKVAIYSLLIDLNLRVMMEPDFKDINLFPKTPAFRNPFQQSPNP
jgi:hypothetical protein